MSDHSHHQERNSLAGKVLKNTGVSEARCYQCGKCTAGCPLASDMDFPPGRLLRMLQIESAEMDEKILRSLTIWLCLSCEMCIGRCPQEVDLPIVMDYLRHEAIRQNKVNPKAKNIIKFHKAFLDSINYTGRLYEVGLIADYKTRSLNLMQDVAIAPTMYLKGKLNLLPDMIKDIKNVKDIFNKTIKKTEEEI